MAAVAFDINYFVEFDDIDIEDAVAKEVAAMGYSFVTDQLAQGSAPPDQDVPFDVLVLTAAEYQPALPKVHSQIIRVTLDGAIPSQDEIRRAIVAGKQVAAALRRGECVLTTCYMGRNRSGLINGLALIELGWCSLDAIDAIKHARGDNALSNAHFKSVLHEYARALGRSSSAALR
jgi:hypothetical protein